MRNVYLLNMLQAPPHQQLQTQVSHAEWLHAQQFHTPLLRTRYLASRAALRQLLAPVLEQAPLDIEFDIGPYQKPVIKHSSWQFSLSHSREQSALVIAPDSIGIDLEHTDTPFNPLLLPLFLTKREQHQLTSPQKSYLFWCIKEAALKAYGTGFYTHPHTVRLQPHTPHSYLAQMPHHTYTVQWLTVAPHLLLALAYSGPITAIKRHEWWSN